MQNKIQNPLTSNSSPGSAGFLTRFFIYFGLAVLFVTATACSTIRLQTDELKEDKRSDLPQNMASASEDIDITRETSCIITVKDDSGTFFIRKEQVAEAQLTEKIVEKIQGFSPDKRIVYIESAVGVQYRTIVKVMDAIRKADIDKAGFVAFREEFKNTGESPGRIEVKLPAEPKEEDQVDVKPNPLTLVVSIDKTGALRLNMETMADTGKLTSFLEEIFKERLTNGVFREGTNEVEKTVFFKASKSLKYGDVLKLIDAVKTAGANPIGMQIDDLSD